MSPFASGVVLPCSIASSSASSCMFWLTRSTNRMSTRARFCGFCAAHAFCAAAALAMTSSTSAVVASGTIACAFPVLGLSTSWVRPPVAATRAPLM